VGKIKNPLPRKQQAKQKSFHKFHHLDSTSLKKLMFCFAFTYMAYRLWVCLFNWGNDMNYKELQTKFEKEVRQEIKKINKEFAVNLPKYLHRILDTINDIYK